MENITSDEASFFWAIMGPVIMGVVGLALMLILATVFVVLYVKRKKQEKAVASAKPTSHNDSSATDEIVDNKTEVPAPPAKEIDPKVDEYIHMQLDLARQKATEQDIAVGDTFEFTLVDLPNGVTAMECYAPMMFSASQYGLKLGVMRNNLYTLMRTE